MAATSTKNTKFHLSTIPATFVTITPTAISKAKPAVVTIASVTGMLPGDIIKIAAGATGFTELDGKVWVVGAVNTGVNTFTLLGSDTTASTGVLAATPAILRQNDADLTAMTCTFSEFSINAETPGNISTATYCDPTGQIPSSVVHGGTVAMKGFIDITSTGYKNLVTAVDDGLERVLRVTLPSNQYLVAPMIFSSISYEIPIDGVQSFSSNTTLSSKWRHLF